MTEQTIAVETAKLDDKTLEVTIRTPTFFEQVRLAGMAPAMDEAEDLDIENETEAGEAIEFTYELLTTLTDLPEDIVETLLTPTVETLMDAINALMEDNDPLDIQGVYAPEDEIPDFTGSTVVDH